MENVDEIVTFYHFAERGLALPTYSFFRGHLYFYGLELHHLNPNSICHIAIFIHFCEVFLGIEPHWNLFRSLPCKTATYLQKSIHCRGRRHSA
jgi:hypothetical protein